MFNMKTTVPFISLLSAITNVAAHGVIAQVSFANGKGGTTSRTAPLPGQGGANNSPIRSVSSQDPNYGTSNPAITCGPDSKAGKEVAEVAPGTKMSFVWKDASGGPWPHNIGPIITYMASCGNQDCNKAGDPANLKWFKTEQVGRKGNSDEWVQADVKDGAPSTATVPENLAPGNYMVRHEIIALHIATEKGKAEFYPGCVAVKVTGTGSGVPKASDLVKFPGAYKDSDPGIFTPNIFDSNVKYAFPGPKVATLAAGAAGTGAEEEVASAAAANAGVTDNVDAAERSTEAGATGSGANPSTEKRSIDKGPDNLRPRRFSRIMKRLLDAEVRAASGSVTIATIKPTAKEPPATPPSDAKNEGAIMVPRRYSRIMKRLVDDLAKNGKLPPL